MQRHGIRSHDIQTVMVNDLFTDNITKVMETNCYHNSRAIWKGEIQSGNFFCKIWVYFYHCLLIFSLQYM